MERQPLNRLSISVIATIICGNVLEWYDFAVYGYFVTIIGRQFFPAEDRIAKVLAGIWCVRSRLRWSHGWCLLIRLGSTAIPNLAAKAIIGINVLLASETMLPEAIMHLASLGYIHRGENLGIPDARGFLYTLQRSSA